ncbi:DUF6708 domain-containing protein [Stenotrophomonas sp. MMGLT7]|uniref:DUF6708 domain-containing protein n=1 Tax=Stenotrophomonas sp. MMGLT7 TaxID=2901227 RepID=UPI001E58D622|nr:DUF6708 domain-containing protein [Stenotrophomonas sp. MMGLT7]MCD7099534.1 hypothetical protein [Stenotrophomonas sp. MMGLT7]
MHYQGIIPGRPFPVNRPLTEQDRKYHLHQDERLEGVTPYPDLIVVKLNSTYLEVVDKYYGWKGYLTFWAFALVTLFSVIGILFGYSSVEKFIEGKSIAYLGGAISLILLSGAIGVFLAFRFEWAYYTHYPIRLNRKTQTVHVFRKNGSVLSVPWKDIFFTLDHDARFWEIRGHVLGGDSETVKETLVLGVSSINNREGMRKLNSHWEFFRRYMAEGPEAVVNYVKWAMPVDGKRESFRVGYECLMSHFRDTTTTLGFLMYVVMWPLLVLASLGRWVAMRLSKLPKWPSEIEAVNVVDPDDPVRIDARINPPELR